VVEVRLDTGEVYQRRPINPDELQMEMFK